ncbi:hypothetical protein AC249_AIPGENE21538 [Exaiptasia diaphana]|nr:hypothetical protein AC249_AIPGENE21538 [Exaiptasia diaphana]
MSFGRITKLQLLLMRILWKLKNQLEKPKKMRAGGTVGDSRIVAALSNERNCVSLMNADDLRDTAKAVNNSMSQNSVQDVSENENTDRVSDSEDDE